jgi:MraZ protein
VFLGQYTPRLDEKGRLTLPAKYRNELAEGLVITKGQDRCLTIYPVHEFERISRRLRAGAVARTEIRSFNRVFFASAADDVPDRQGRVTIPEKLRQYAGLDRDCVVIGNNGTVEVWQPEAWAAFEGPAEEGFADLADLDLPELDPEVAGL